MRLFSSLLMSVGMAASASAAGGPAAGLSAAGGSAGTPGAGGAGNADPRRGPYPDYLLQHAQTRAFMLGRPVKARPTPDGKAVLFLRAAPRVPELHLFQFDVASRQVTELLTPQQLLQGAAENLSAEEKARRERMRVSVRGFTSFDLSRDGALILVSLSGRLYTIRRADGRVTELPTGLSAGPAGGQGAGQGAGQSAVPAAVIDPQFSPDGKHVAYVRERDLYVLDLGGADDAHGQGYKEHRLTHSDKPWISYGLAEFVAQEELGRFSGYCWSPDSQHLAFEEADTQGVEIFHIVDAAHPENAAAATPYPRPGKDNARVRVGIIQATGNATGQAPGNVIGQAGGKAGGKADAKADDRTPTWVSWDAGRYPYLATLRWSDKAPLTLVVASRQQQDLAVLAADERGQTRTLLTEHDAAWLNLDQEMPRWLDDGSGFLWTSERSGGWELELRDPAGALVRVLVDHSAGYRGLADVTGTAAGAGQAVVLASPEPSESRLYRVPLRGGTLSPLSTEGGVQQASFGKDHSLYVRSLSTLTAMPRTTVHRADGGELGELPSVAEEPPFHPRVTLEQVGARAFRTALLRPRDFVAGKKYPVVLDVYGGPHALQVTATMARFLLPQWLADHGFIVVMIDGRGTPARGREWERAIRGDFATVPLADQIEALGELGKNHPELDLSRVGVYGWSFGGYMAALSVLKRPDVFKVGVAGAPVVDWRDYDTAYTERYLGLPQENAQGYEDSSLLSYAAGLSRPLLLIHGTSDDNVYFFHSLKLSQALFRAGKAHDFLPLSGLTHMVPDPLVTQRLWGRIVDKLAETLKP